MNRGLTILAAMAFVAGCAHYEPRPLSPAQSAAGLDGRSLDGAEFRHFLERNSSLPPSWPPQSWDFESLYLAALYFHPSLEVARAQWRVALGGEKTAAERPNPSVSAQPGYDFSATSPVNPWIPGVVFDVPIETMGKRGYRKAQAAHLAASARRDIAATAWRVRANLRGRFIDYIAARKRSALLNGQIAIQRRVLESLGQQQQAGALSASELTQYRIALSRLELEVADARVQETDSQARLAEAIGVPLKALRGVNLAYDLAAPHPAADSLLSLQARDEALTNRADIQGALEDYAASQSALQLEIAKQYPDIHLAPYYQYNNGDHQFTLQITADLPVFNQNQGPIAEAEAKRSAAAAQFLALQSRIMAEVDRSVAGYQVTRENLAGLDSLAAAQRKQMQSIAAQQQAGAVSEFDVLGAKLELTAGELVQLDGQIKLQQAYAALEDAVQRPIDSPQTTAIESPSEARHKTKGL